MKACSSFWKPSMCPHGFRSDPHAEALPAWMTQVDARGGSRFRAADAFQLGPGLSTGRRSLRAPLGPPRHPRLGG